MLDRNHKLLPARLPPPVRPGDRVGVAALSGRADPDLVAAGMAALAELGYRPVAAPNLGRRQGLFAGSDRERLAGFHQLAADPEIRAIFFARGGHGLLRVLPGIDWRLLRAHPRAYVGYSDLTPLLLEVTRRLGLVTFHGPLVAAELAQGLAAEEAASLTSALAGSYPQALALPCWERAGEARGPLLGGCLSLLTATLGTRFAPRLAGSVLFVEEVREPLYRLDRMLTHLRLSGVLEKIAGLCFGHIVWSQPECEDPAGAWRGLVDSSLAEFTWPLAAGLASGHQRPNLTLPLGLLARMDPAGCRLVLGEA